MRIVVVRFKGSEREYEYKTSLNLIVGGTYEIIADGRTSYTNPVVVQCYRVGPKFDGELREITEANCLKAAPRPDDGIKNVYFNEKKSTTVVIWKDDVKTIVKCDPKDVFNKEVGLAMCYMKRFHKNRGCFNETLKKYCV